MPKSKFEGEERQKSLEKRYKRQYQWQKKNMPHLTVVVPAEVKDILKTKLDVSINSYVNDLIVRDLKERGLM